MWARDRINAKFDIDDDDIRPIYFFLSKHGIENEPIIGYWMMRPYSLLRFTKERIKSILLILISIFQI